MICGKLDLCVEEELSGKTCSKCDNIRIQCIESSDNRSAVKCEEKSKKYVLENTMKKHIISYRMDGGVVVTDASVPKGTNKCDYLFVNNAESLTAILIELKGIDVSKALKQIHDTLILFKDFFKKFTHVYGRAIVTASTPNLKATPEYVNLERKIRKIYNGNIKIVQRQFREKDIDLSKK